MPKIDSLHTMFVQELYDIYDAEQRLTKAIPKLVKAATNEALIEALAAHLTETAEHVTRLEKAFEALAVPRRGKPCAGIRGILEEGAEDIAEDFGNDALRDATIIGAAQRAEHYEIAAYGTAIAHARVLGLDDVAEILNETLAEEKTADRTLTGIADKVVNQEAARNTDAARARVERMGSRN